MCPILVDSSGNIYLGPGGGIGDSEGGGTMPSSVYDFYYKTGENALNSLDNIVLSFQVDDLTIEQANEISSYNIYVRVYDLEDNEIEAGASGSVVSVQDVSGEHGGTAIRINLAFNVDPSIAGPGGAINTHNDYYGMDFGTVEFYYFVGESLTLFGKCEDGFKLSVTQESVFPFDMTFSSTIAGSNNDNELEFFVDNPTLDQVFFFRDAVINQGGASQVSVDVLDVENSNATISGCSVLSAQTDYQEATGIIGITVSIPNTVASTTQIALNMYADGKQIGQVAAFRPVPL